jgi:uridylate kinase
MPAFKRIILKLSGEALQGSQNHGIDPVRLNDYVEEVIDISDMGIQTGIVIGGGNIFRGLSGVNQGFDRVRGDHMGMLATVINGLALQSALESKNRKCRVFTAVRMEPFAEFYTKSKVLEAFRNNEIAILTAGTGNPFFTTDTAAVLRAIETGADAVLKGTRVDGVYDCDPEKYESATRFDELTFDEAINRQLNVMDITAFAMCRENKLPIVVFNMNVRGNLKKLISGEKIGTLIKI